MTDRRRAGSRPTSENNETWSRVSKLSQDKFKAKKYSKGRKQSQSPCLGTSLYYQKDYDTPKRQSRNRFIGCSTGDSPSEAEALQDIIWDPASPPPVWNGKGPGEGVRVVEISDLVNRIAPKDEKPVDRDLVLQWIGDSAVPCTPEIQQPRVRRISARRQSNNVEDLMKLAKQFDINMTRQDEERQLENKARNTEGQPKPENPTASHSVLDAIEPSAGQQASVPAKPKGLSHEEELHALFDGPTQYMSGRLSPPSVNSSQESRTGPVALEAQRPESKNIPEKAVQVLKAEFDDDDWENDDLLNDSFVLEMTQNPDLFCSVPKASSGQKATNTCRKPEPANVPSSSGSGIRASSFTLSNHCTKILSNAQCSTPSTFRPPPNAAANTEIVQQMPKSRPDLPKTWHSESHQVQAQKSNCNRHVVTAVDLERTKREFKDHREVGTKHPSSLPSRKDRKTLDASWSDGDDDDLLYQVCDDVERISASQEQQQQQDCTELESDKTTKQATSSVDTTCLLVNTSANNKTTQPGQPKEARQASRIFARSHSVPGASNAFGNKQNCHESSQMSHSPQPNSQYRFTRVKNTSRSVLHPQWTASALQEVSMHNPPMETPTISHHSTFKRHQSDPVALTNKVFIATQPVVKCTAAEIERKKQEAIARRRLRLQASQKPGAPT